MLAFLVGLRTGDDDFCERAGDGMSSRLLDFRNELRFRSACLLPRLSFEAELSLLLRRGSLGSGGGCTTVVGKCGVNRVLRL